MKQRTWKDADLVDAVKTSQAASGVMRKLGLKPAGGNYKTIRRAIERLNLSTDHWTGQAHGKGRSYPTYTLEAILVENSAYTNSLRLKIRLLAAGLLQRKCSSCGRAEWLGKPIPLELEHKNGRNRDHRLSNLTLLCPNCHAQTDSYRGRNIKTNIPVDKCSLEEAIKVSGMEGAAIKFGVAATTIYRWRKKLGQQ